MEARDEIHNLLSNEEARQVPCLIFANKQDLPDAVKTQELTEMLGLLELVSKKTAPMVKIQESSAFQDRGLLEGFEWITDRIV